MSIELKQAAQRALNALDEATTYTGSPSWSPSMTDECIAAASALRTALAQQPATTEPLEDGIRNAEDELNCAEEVLDAITCEFSDGEFPVTDFNCIGDYITAVVDVFKERLAAQHPATGEPVAWRNVIPGGRKTDEWESTRIADYNLGWNAYRKAAKTALEHLETSTQPLPSAWMYTLEYGGTIADTKVSLRQLNYPFGVCGADYLRENSDGISYVRQTPLYTPPAPSVPDEKPLPDLMMASYHEAIGWNACRAAMLAANEGGK